MNVVRRDYASLIPIEDMKDGDVVHNSQLVPTETVNVPAVYELAYLGLSTSGVAARLKVTKEALAAHFPKTIAQARADAAVEALLRLQDTANGDLKPTAPQLDATKHLLEKRLDPLPKEGVSVTIAQSFRGVEAMAQHFSIDDLNEV